MPSTYYSAPLLPSLILTAVLLAGEQAPSDRELAAALDRAVSSGQREQAGLTLRQLLALPHVSLDVLLETGAKLAERDLYEAASAVFSLGMRQYPENFELRYNLALADFALGRFPEARAALDTAPHLTPAQRSSREYLRGKIYEALGQHDLAEQSLTTALHGAPANENFALDLGLLYLRRQKYDKALAVFEAETRRHPDSIYSALGLGIAQLLGDDAQKAIATCGKILARDANFAPARLLLAMAYYMGGENENCVREAARAASIPGAPPYLYYLHAASLLKLNARDYAVMLSDLDLARRGLPDCALCYFAQSKVHQAMGDEPAAIADLVMLVDHVDPEFAQAWYRLANIYERTGRHEEAARALTKFRLIRTKESGDEAEYLRKAFLSALGSQGSTSAQ